MDMKNLRVWLSLAETCNFSRSAEQLHMSVSSVSRSIQRLESEVGHALLERDRRNVALTPAGRDFVDYARRAVKDWEDTRRRLGAGEALVGQVNLYCSVTATYSILAPILEAFRASHPGLDIQLHTGDPADGVDKLLSSQHDLVVIGRPETLPRRLSYLELLESPMRLCMPAADCAVSRQVLAADTASPDFDWRDLPFIVPERGVTRDMFDHWCDDMGFVPRIYAQVAGHEAVVAMVGLGLGVGIAPELVIRTSGIAGRVKPVSLWRPLPALGIGLCAARGALDDPRVRAFWDEAASVSAQAGS